MLHISGYILLLSSVSFKHTFAVLSNPNRLHFYFETAQLYSVGGLAGSVGALGGSMKDSAAAGIRRLMLYYRGLGEDHCLTLSSVV